MRRLFMLIGILIIICIFGYFIYLNNHKVHLGLFGAFSLQISLWIIIFTTFLVGFFLSWFYQLVFHPGRIVQRTKQAFIQYQHNRQEQRHQHFFDAVLRRDFKAIRSSFKKLKRTSTLPLYVTLQYLKQQRYQKSSADLLEAYQALKQQFPNNLQVLLAYQKLAIEKQEWGVVELLSEEILQLERDHPSGLEGMRDVYQHRQEWEKCVRQEIKLLTRFPQSMLAEKLFPQHEAHLLKGLQNNPKLIQETNLNYLPSKSSFQAFHQVSLILGEARQLCQIGQNYKAAHLLKRNYEKTAAPVLLDELEAIFHQTGRSEKVLKLFEELRQSSSNTIFVDLIYARIHYRNHQLDPAKRFLNDLSARQKHLPLLFHILNYLIALAEQNQEKQLEAAQTLIQADRLLDHLYSCTQCGASGNWQPICHRCQQTYSYVYKETLA